VTNGGVCGGGGVGMGFFFLFFLWECFFLCVCRCWEAFFFSGVGAFFLGGRGVFFFFFFFFLGVGVCRMESILDAIECLPSRAFFFFL